MKSVRVPGVEGERLLERIFSLNEQAAVISRVSQPRISIGMAGIEPNRLLRGGFRLLQRFRDTA